MTGDEIESSDDGDRHDAGQNSFPECGAQSLLSLGNWIAPTHPIGTEVVRDIKHLDVGESHSLQRVGGGLDVRAVVPRATAAVDDDELLSGSG